MPAADRSYPYVEVGASRPRGSAGPFHSEHGDRRALAHSDNRLSPPLYLPEPFVTGLSSSDRMSMGMGSSMSTGARTFVTPAGSIAVEEDEEEVIDLTDGPPPPRPSRISAATQTTSLRRPQLERTNQLPSIIARTSSSNTTNNSRTLAPVRTARAARQRDRQAQQRAYAQAIDLDAEPDVAPTSTASANAPPPLPVSDSPAHAHEPFTSSRAPFDRGSRLPESRFARGLPTNYHEAVSSRWSSASLPREPLSFTTRSHEARRTDGVIDSQSLRRDGGGGGGGGGIYPRLEGMLGYITRRGYDVGGGGGAHGGDTLGARPFQTPNMDYERGFAAQPPLFYEGGFLTGMFSGVNAFLGGNNNSNSHDSRSPMARKYVAPEPCKEPFTRTFKQTDTLVCPQCRSELGGSGPLELGKSTTEEEETRRRIFVTKCGHVYCGDCAHKFKAVFAKSKSKGVRCHAPDCGHSITKTKLFEVFV